MRREELTDAAPAGWCRGGTRADEHTRGDQRRGGRRKSRVSHDTPLEVGQIIAFANRLVKPFLATLFKSREAEQANLARAYRKLGIRSRAELGVRFSERRKPAEA
jgi:hypothetical protein